MDFGSLMPQKPHIGTYFGFLMPKKKKPHIGMNFGPLLLKKRKHGTEKFLLQNGALLLQDELKNIVGSVNIFRARDIEKATMNFAENMIIGRGTYGIVHRGILPDYRVVAIKRCKISDQQQLEQFVDEIVIIGRINHRNVVQLLGCCLETEVPLLAYEFVSNGTLYDHIHNKTSGTGRLSWDRRLRIAHESAGALDYLHSNGTMTIIHRDVKSSNILLDKYYTAKVADFGAPKSVPLGDDHVNALVCGTTGYLDPEYFHTGQLTDKSDVYSFGVVLAELLTGLKPIDSIRLLKDKNLAAYFVKADRENQLREIVDIQVLEEATHEQLEAACYLTCRCLHIKGEYRPSIKEVTVELEKIRKITRRYY